MSGRYIISIDQSTQGTKALLFDKNGTMMCRSDMAHKQMINDKGWVSHDPEEIYENMLKVIRNVLVKANISPEMVEGIGISNQRETSCIWNCSNGLSFAPAVVWQCTRAAELCEQEVIQKNAQMIFQRTGLKLSPYFPAAKIAWLLENVPGIKEEVKKHQVCHGTMDSYLIYRLTKGEVYATDYSNASRTQLFNIFTLQWDEEICKLFGIERENMPKVMDSDACYGYTDCEGLFSKPIPIHAVMGDSHAALFCQNCRRKGLAKATYGTGSSIMLNIGEKPVLSTHGLVTSLAWSEEGKVQYVLEGNLNYTGSVITWLKDDMKMIDCPNDSESLARIANQRDHLYLVPAFSGLGAPYWNTHARAALIGMDRTTGKPEMVRAALECIAYQITDILRVMNEDSGQKLAELRVDGGPTRNEYLMQFQSDMAGCRVLVPDVEELSGIGAAYMAGIALGMWREKIFEHIHYNEHVPKMEDILVTQKYCGWKDAVQIINKSI